MFPFHKGGTLGLLLNKGISIFPTQWTYVSLRWFLYTKFCFYFQQFLMERSREKILSRVDSMGTGFAIPGQTHDLSSYNLLAFSGLPGMMVFPAPSDGLDPHKSAPEFLGINLCFPPAISLRGMGFLTSLSIVQGLSCLLCVWACLAQASPVGSLCSFFLESDIIECHSKMGPWRSLNSVVSKPPEDL